MTCASDVHKWTKMFNFKFNVAIRVRLNVERLTLILKPQSVVFLGGFSLKSKIRVSVPIFNTLLWVRVKVRVKNGYDFIYSGTY